MSAAVLVLIPVLLYFMLIRPQRQRVNAQRSMLGALTPGDEILTAGGLIGTVVRMDGDEVSVQIAPGTVVRFALTAVVRRVTPPQAEVPSSREEAGPLPADPGDAVVHDEPLRHEDGE